MWDLFFISLIPLVLFVIVDYKSGLKSGIWTAFISSIVLGFISWWILGELDSEFLVMIAAVAATGFMSVRQNNAIYFKFQPVVTNVVGILFIAWFQFFDTPIMVKYLPKMQKFMAREQFEMLSQPAFSASLARMSLYLMVAMAAHSIIVAFAAVRLKNKHWLLAKALGLPFIVISSLAMSVIFDLANQTG